MASLPDYIEYFPAFKLLLCKAHGLCLTEPQIFPHLRSRQHNINKETRYALVQAVNHLDIAANASDVCLPVAGSAPIKGLPILDGFECCFAKECPYLTTSAGALHLHLTRCHPRDEDSKRKPEYRNKVKVQKLFQYLRHSGYFIVNPESSVRGFPQVSAGVVKNSVRPSSSKNSRTEVIDLEDDASESGVGNPRFRISKY